MKMITLFRVVTVLLFFTFSSILILTMVFEMGPVAKGSLELEEYKYHKYNPVRNISRSGIITRPKIETGYISFENEEGAHVLISSVESKTFKCTGFCYCEDYGMESRRTTGVISRGMIYLLAAISSIKAYELARDHFQDTCETELSNKCSFDSIRSGVDVCVENRGMYKRLKYKHLEIDPMDDLTVVKPEDNPDTVKLDLDLEEGIYDVVYNNETSNEYWCKGTCMTIPFFKERERDYAEVFECETYEREGWVDIPPDFKKGPEYQFSRIHMHMYCRGVSKQEFIDWKWSQRADQYLERKTEISLCCGFLANRGGNPSVTCQEYHENLFDDERKWTPEEIDEFAIKMEEDEDLDNPWEPDPDEKYEIVG